MALFMQVLPVEAASLVKTREDVPVRGNDTVYFCTVDGWGTTLPLPNCHMQNVHITC